MTETITMKFNDGQRPFLEKVANDTREYVQSLIEENQRLGRLLAEVELERDHARNALQSVRSELHGRDQMEAVLKQRIEAVEEESRRFSERYLEVEQQNTNLANLYVASYQLNGTLDRERVIAAIQEIVINLIGSEELAIWEVDEELDVLSLVSSFGIDHEEWIAVPMGSGTVGSVAASGSLYLAAAGEEPHHDRERALTACLPLKLDDRVVGVIGIFRLLQQKPGLEPVDHELLDLLGSHAASALFCTRLYSRYTGAQQ
jgi:GAF domain-containing protein